MQPPTGTVTFLFTDIEGSTSLWEQFPQAMHTALACHDELLRRAIAGHNGTVFKTIGDAFCAVFPSAQLAVQAALESQFLLQDELPPAPIIKVRMALNTGIAEHRDNDYFGQPLNRVARLLSVAHGGQVLLSQSTVELVRDQLPAPITLVDLGSHKLRDLSRPETIFQLGHPRLPSEFPRLTSLNNSSTNLPAQTTSFIGREQEISEIKKLLTTTRLLTLTGPGGAGKTRLSLQVAADMQDQFSDGIWFIELAPLSDPALVPQAVAQAMNFPEEGGRSLIQTLIANIGSRKILLMLDNCEHLLHACAELSSALLRSCSNIKILTSSREGMSIAGETLYRIPPLSRPDLSRQLTPQTLLQYEAVKLFVERASAVAPAFNVTRQNAPALAQVCHRLDGIPLAIELAAARVRALSIEAIATRLDDRFRLLTGGSRTALPRQQTLRALIDWSYDLLNDQEKTLLRRLSVFAGGWSLEAAEAVCAGNPVEEWELLDFLTSLVDKSLVIYEETEGTARYRLLETVRQYSRDRLAEFDETGNTKRLFRTFFLKLAEEAMPQLQGPDAATWLNSLQTENDNLRAAFDDCIAALDGGEQSLRLSASLMRFWEIRGYFAEGRERLTAALAHPDAQGRTEARSNALHGAGNLAMKMGNYDLARSYYEESLAIRREIDYQRGICGSLINLGVLAQHQADYQTARAHYLEALPLTRALKNVRWEAVCLENLGEVAISLGEFAEARQLNEQSLALARSSGDNEAIAHSLHQLGNVACKEGHYAEARKSLRECLRLCLEAGNRYLAAFALEAYAEVCRLESEKELATLLYAAAHQLRDLIGSPLPPYRQEEYSASIADLRDTLGTEYSDTWARGLDWAWEQAVQEVLLTRSVT